MKTKLQIIQETADYYSADPSKRAVNDGNCYYFSPDEQKCAIGRLSKIPKKLEDVSRAYYTIEELLPARFSDKQIFKKDYQGHEVKFWMDLQNFHDSNKFWTKTGLSAKGRNKLESLKKKYK